MTKQYIRKNEFGTYYYGDPDFIFYHKEDGPAVERHDGSKLWYLNGKRHRLDGPAVEYANGDKIWYVNGKLHRKDGPAIEYADGEKQWWFNDEKYSEKEFYIAIGRKNLILFI